MCLFFFIKFEETDTNNALLCIPDQIYSTIVFQIQRDLGIGLIRLIHI